MTNLTIISLFPLTDKHFQLGFEMTANLRDTSPLGQDHDAISATTVHESVSSTLAAIAIKSGTCKHSSVFQVGAQRVYELQKRISLSSSYEESYGDNSHSTSFGCVSV